MRVLVVDDSAMDRKLAGGLITRQVPGSVVTFAGDGRAALEALGLATELPDVVLTDLQMPELDGLELVRAVRQRHPQLPVVLMTAHGSEDIAVRALREGAASYVPKSTLATELVSTLRAVLDVVRATRDEARLFALVTLHEQRFELESDVSLVPALVGHLESALAHLGVCDETGCIQVSVALREALVNAMHHGNLEVSSTLLEREGEYARAIARRRAESPYRERRVRVHARVSRDEATFEITDEGPGFDPSSLPDPTDPQNLDKPSGRGLLLIQTFMDEVRHNARGNQITLVKRRGDAPLEG